MSILLQILYWRVHNIEKMKKAEKFTDSDSIIYIIKHIIGIPFNPHLNMSMTLYNSDLLTNSLT